MNTGHDEYYSDNMRTNVQNGNLLRREHGALQREQLLLPHHLVAERDGRGEPRVSTLTRTRCPNSTTFEWRLLQPPLQHPENEIGGVMLGGVANDRPFLVADASSWIYAGTGLHTYTGNGTNNIITSGANQNALPGIVGYEFDSRASTTPALSPYVQWEPAGLQTLGHSFVPAADGNAVEHVERRDAVHGAERRRPGLLGRHDPVVVGPRRRLRQRLLRLRAGQAVRERGDAARHDEHHQPLHRAVDLRSPPGPSQVRLRLESASVSGLGAP